MVNLTTNKLPAWKSLLIQCKSRNRVLYTAGLLSLMGTFVCGLLVAFSNLQVLGVNAFVKPFKFFGSISTVCFTMAWILVYLNNQKTVKIYSWVLVFAMVIELVIITGQAALGKTSHFNTATLLDGILFQLMGIAIVVFTLWTGWICYCFFRQKEWPIWMSPGYLWGMRLGLLFFVIFAFEGMHMVYLNQHTIGAPDGSAGLPLTNWSREFGDLRVPHFFGLHTLQLLPLAGYYLFPKKTTMVIMAITWLAFIALLYWQALQGFPIIP